MILSLLGLDRDRGLRRRPVDHPGDIPKAVEEFLRHEAPVQALARTVSRDVEIGGHRLRPGDRALLVWAAANRDPDVFERPDEINIDRFPNRHLSFGVGLHRCLGSGLGRLMVRIMLERLLTAIPDYRLGDDPRQYRFDEDSVIYSVRSLPATFTPEGQS